MDIVQYLIELLKTRKQVGIEGLGTLYKKKIPGRYDAETHSFLPPSYDLNFTQDILEEYNLIEFIHSKRGISPDAAKYFISQFVAEVLNKLETGEFQFENLGKLEKNEDGSIVFHQNEGIETGFEFFALPSVVAEVHNRNELNEQKGPDTDESIKQNEQPIDVNTKITEPEIEQIQVPEFEQEMKMVPAEEEIIEQEEVEAIAENEEPAHVDKSEEEHDNDVTDENQTKEIEIEDTEPLEDEVFEEINEVDFQTFTASNTKVDEKENWDFGGDNVIIEEDTQKEKFETTAVHHEISTSTNDTNDAIKLTSTLKEWDFDTVGDYRDEQKSEVKPEFDGTANDSNETDEKTKTPLYIKLGIALLIIALVVAAIYFFKPELFSSFSKNDTDPDQKIAIPIEPNNLKNQQDSLSFADSIMKSAEKAGLKVEPAKDTLAVTTTKTEVASKFTYDIIITSFATESKAQQYIASLKKKGFNAKISTMPGKRKNISIANYNNEDSAKKDVIKFRKQFKNPEIYVQPIKNN
jgi:nucleoid DNA-binding protein